MIEMLQSVFTNREIAAIIWIIVVAGIVLSINKDVRSGVLDVLKGIFNRKIITALLFAWAYTELIIYLLSMIKMWDATLIKDTIVWFFLSAISILFHLTRASDDKNYFRDIVRQNFQIVIVIEFIANLHSFSIWIEMIILPIIIGLSIKVAIAEVNEIPSGGNLAKTFLVIYGLLLIIFSIIDIVKSVRDYSNIETIRSFIFPIILTISFIPCAYFIALLMEYESLFASTKMFFNDKSRLRYIGVHKTNL